MSIENIRSLIALWTNNNKLDNVFMKFNGWLYNPSDVIRELIHDGYTVDINCMTYRHHAAIHAYR